MPLLRKRKSPTNKEENVKKPQANENLQDHAFEALVNDLPVSFSHMTIPLTSNPKLDTMSIASATINTNVLPTLNKYQIENTENDSELDITVSKLLDQIESKQAYITCDISSNQQSTDSNQNVERNSTCSNEDIFNEDTILNLSPWTRKKTNDSKESASDDALHTQTVFFSNKNDTDGPYKIKITFV